MFCLRCGGKLQLGKCSCGYQHFENPIPVLICLLPVIKDGRVHLLGIRRKNAPKIGEIALPGGYQEIEDPYLGLAREVQEETGLNLVDIITEVNSQNEDFFGVKEVDILKSKLHFLKLEYTPDCRSILIFYQLSFHIPENKIDFSFKSKETSEVLLINEDTKIAFPLHKQLIEEYFRFNYQFSDEIPF